MKNIVILFLAMQTIAFAQKDLTRVVAFREGTTASLRWLDNLPPNLIGYHVERSTNGSPFTRLTPAPVRRILEVSELNSVIGAGYATYYLGLLNLPPETSVISPEVFRSLSSNENGRAFFVVMTITEPRFGLAMGQVWKDTGVGRNDAVRYRIMSVFPDGERELISTPDLPKDRIDPVPIPIGVSGMGRDASVELKWKYVSGDYDSGRVVRANVYRATDSLGPYDERTLLASLPVVPRAQATNTTWYDRIVDNGARYFYYVTFTDATGREGAGSDIVAVVVGEDVMATPPAAFTATEFGSGLRLTWQYSTQLPIKGFQIERAANEGPMRPLPGATPSLLTPSKKEFLDANVESGVTYRYVINAVTSRPGMPSDTLATFIPDRIPPHPPVAVQATPDTTVIRVSWTAPTDTDLDGYDVQRSQGRYSAWFTLNNGLVRGMQFSDTIGHNHGVDFSYRVIAFDKSGNRSRPSDTVVARLVDTRPPARVWINGFRNTGDVIDLSWTQSGSADLRHYVIERSSDSGKSYKFRYRTRELKAADTVTASGFYMWRIVAVDSAGNKSTSEARGLQIDMVPRAPEGLVAAVRDRGIMLTWSPPPHAAGYLLQRIDPRTNEKIDLSEISGGATSYYDMRSSQKQDWIYRLRARTDSWVLGPAADARYRASK